MAVLNKQDFLNSVYGFVNSSSTDNDVTALSNIVDTYYDMENKLNSSEDWKKKYEDNDAAWRERYKERFTSSVPNPDEADEHDTPDVPDEQDTPNTFMDLFKVKE